MGHPISADTVRTELVKLGFSRQFNRKADEVRDLPLIGLLAAMFILPETYEHD